MVQTSKSFVDSWDTFDFKIFFLTEYPIRGTYLHLPRHSSIDACPIRNLTSLSNLSTKVGNYAGSKLGNVGQRGREREWNTNVHRQADNMHMTDGVHMAGRRAYERTIYWHVDVPDVRLPYSNNIFLLIYFVKDRGFRRKSNLKNVAHRKSTNLLQQLLLVSWSWQGERIQMVT